MSGDWACEYYGPEGAAIGAVCFVAAASGACASLDECHEAMTAVRRNIYRKISELAATGDPVGVDLAEAFPDPERILNRKDDS